jgi:hypothetical protein
MTRSREGPSQSAALTDVPSEAVLTDPQGNPVSAQPVVLVVASEEPEASINADGVRTAPVIGTGLLPHLAGRFRRQAEVVAMEALHWILATDPVSQEWFCDRLARLDSDRAPRAFEFEAEVQRDGTRPDLVAIDPESRQEVVLIEAKFWAALQPSQPLEYLKRAREMVVILGPDQGATTWLWPEVCARAGVAPDGARELSHVVAGGKRLAYLKWSDVLEIETSRPSTARAREELEALVDVYGATDPTVIDDATLDRDGLARTESLIELVARVRDHVEATYGLRRRGASAYLPRWHCYGGQHVLKRYNDSLEELSWRVDLRFSFEGNEGPLVFELELDKDTPAHPKAMASREVGHGAFRWDKTIAWPLPLRKGVPIDECVHDAGDAIRAIVERVTGLHLGKAAGAHNTEGTDDLAGDAAAEAT